MLRNFFLILILTLNAFFVKAQTITITGKITDIQGKPLPFANVIADPKGNSLVSFAISDKDGGYKLDLETEESYRLTISYLGYIPQNLEVTAKEDLVKNFMLRPSSEELGEVTLNYTPPVVVKKDTITYRTDAFTTGEERKLRDILKKLPAVEVDRAGNVIVQGKKVTKILVEDKQFFTGDSKLAVNNIPADAVEKVQVLDNYSEVSFLKGLEDSNEVAMNIKLKKDKKRFIFGDIEVGGGIEDRYLLHPSLYYYSPKTNINVIGDFNNIGVKSFTIKDYLEFEGGRNKLINDTKNYFSLLNDDFAQFLGSQDFVSNRNQFGALSISKEITTKIDFSSYGIWSSMKNETEVQTLNNYLFNDDLIENRTNSGIQESRFGIGKFTFKYKPDNVTDVTFGTYIKTSGNRSENNILTAIQENNNTIVTNVDADNISVKQDIEWHKQFNEKNTTSAIFNYKYQKVTPNTNWLTDASILQGLIPLITEDTYNIFKNKVAKSNSIDFMLKHYWVLNRFNHIYVTLGSELTFDNYSTNEFQKLEDESINDFSDSNFGNDTNFNFSNNFLGVHYKFQKGKVTFKPGIFYHFYNWNFTQIIDRTTNSKAVLLPEFTADVEFSNTKKITFKYNLKTRFPSISQLANRFTLLSFNSIYQGNQRLENELYHQVQLRFYRFNLFKDVFYNFTANYRVKEENFKNSTTIQGIDFVSSPILADFEDKLLSFMGSFKKGIGKYKFSLNGRVSLANYDKPVNSELIDNTSNSYSFGGGVETRFKKFPNIELRYTKSISEYSANDVSSEFQTDVITAYLEYDFLKNFILTVDYSFETYENKAFDITSVFDVANASLFYQKENSPWGFEINANNLFNVGFRQRNLFSSVLVSDEKTFILPRIIMLKLSYKL
jgi:hypothetical protein